MKITINPKSKVRMDPMAAMRMERRDLLEKTLKEKFDVALRYDSRLCLNYINQTGKVLSETAIAEQLILMDHLYHETPYAKMMGRLLTSHWRHCSSIDRNQLSDVFSEHCKKRIELNTTSDLTTCSADHCVYQTQRALGEKSA